MGLGWGGEMGVCLISFVFICRPRCSPILPRHPARRQGEEIWSNLCLGDWPLLYLGQGSQGDFLHFSLKMNIIFFKLLVI